MRRINPDRPLTQTERNKRHYDKHKASELERNKEYHRNNKEKVAKRHRLVAMKMTPERYDELMEEQNSRCAVCGEKFKKTPHIDHKHSCCDKRPTCGQCNRGLLCDDCNLGLGRFKDSITLLENAIQYLEKWNGH